MDCAHAYMHAFMSGGWWHSQDMHAGIFHALRAPSVWLESSVDSDVLDLFVRRRCQASPAPSRTLQPLTTVSISKSALLGVLPRALTYSAYLALTITRVYTTPVLCLC